jgi:HSP20 family protein
MAERKKKRPRQRGAERGLVGNIRRGVKSERSEVQEVREPLVDIFEEEDHLLVVGELPGIAKEDVKIEIQEDVLLISAERGDRKYRKKVLLPRDVTRGKLRVSCKNGVLEIKCPK